jgi:hypothetical protein
MTASLYEYYPDQVVVVFGPLIISGASDTIVSVQYNTSAFSLKVGAYGDSVRSRTNDHSATITVTLLQGSGSNNELSAIHFADRHMPGGTGIFPLMVKDNSGATLHSAATAWIRDPPASTFGTEAQDREWTFETNCLVSHIGGARERS